MREQKYPFNIPAINNAKMALMVHLDLDGENDVEYQSVKELKCIRTTPPFSISVFEYNDDIYHVSSNNSGLKADIIQAFNSNLWAISKLPRMDDFNSRIAIETEKLTGPVTPIR